MHQTLLLQLLLGLILLLLVRTRKIPLLAFLFLPGVGSVKVCINDLTEFYHHFKSHQYTEEADGMFGMLIVQLICTISVPNIPSAEFTAGDLVVQHLVKNIKGSSSSLAGGR